MSKFKDDSTASLNMRNYLKRNSIQNSKQFKSFGDGKNQFYF
jgi:hypothetical protein